MTDRELMQMVLDTLSMAVEPKKGKVYAFEFQPINCAAMHLKAIEALRARLAQPEQTNEKGKPITYWGGLAQPEREWVGLTDAEIAEAGKLFLEGNRMLPFSFARAIEAKLKEKNGV